MLLRFFSAFFQLFLSYKYWYRRALTYFTTLKFQIYFVIEAIKRHLLLKYALGFNCQWFSTRFENFSLRYRICHYFIIFNWFFSLLLFSFFQLHCEKIKQRPGKCGEPYYAHSSTIHLTASTAMLFFVTTISNIYLILKFIPNVF